MNNSILMTAEFERQKNLKASAYTLGIAGALLLFLLFVKITTKIEAQQPVEEYIEVNLGSGDEGSGTDQPQLPGEPAPMEQTAYVPPQPVQSIQESVRDVEANDVEREAPPIIKPTVTRPNATRINDENRTTRTTTTTPQQVTAPPQPRPRAVMGQVRGGEGTGGNGADTYRPGTNEGIAGGNGDQGRTGGNPNGTSYTGQPRRLSVRSVSIPAQNFEDDFKESGKVMLDISVDENGRLLSATYQPRGSTISNRSQISIAQRRARELSFPKYPGGFKQTLRFDFEVRD